MNLQHFKNWFRRSSPDRRYSAEELPLRSELFSADQMEEHGKTLAGTHGLSRDEAPNRLLRRLAENEDVLIGVHGLLTAALKSDRQVEPAGEWLLDNFYLIEDQIRTTRRHLPKSYSRELPRLENGPSAGLPRVYDIALETISRGDGRVDMDALCRFVASYQTITTLKLGELWAIPTMLRLALIENLRRVGARMASGRMDRNRANYWADQITGVAERDPTSLIMTVADMTRASPRLSSSFVAELARRLQGQSAALALPLTWIEQRLSESGLTIQRLVQFANQQQAADQVSISNSIGSLRTLGVTDWREFVESMSAVEKTLRSDPTQTYPAMSFATRDRYRHVVERIAKRDNIPEKTIAEKAVELAGKVVEKGGPDSRAAHVGFYLVDKGLPELEQALGVQHSAFNLFLNKLRKHPLAVYAGSITLLTATLTAVLLQFAYDAGLRGTEFGIFAVVSFFSISQFGVAIVNWLATLLIEADSLSKMDFSEGIPPKFRTLTVIPTLLSNTQHVKDLVEKLEVRFLANRETNLHFGLLTDFRDAASETTDEDAPLLQLAKDGIEELNKKYDPDKEETFFLFHRPRQWNPHEAIWMGCERKRGKLGDLNRLLRGKGADRFSLIVGKTEVLSNVTYVITLDTDTELPRDSARKLAAAMAHPLNRPVYDEARQRVTDGYGILQPRVAVSLPCTNRSRYARMFGSEPGIDPYTRAVSDVYQDVFGEGSFIGKGIYDVDAFERALHGRLPENLILSHDLIEGCYARAALLSDVPLYEEYPSRYNMDVNRWHRWVRGDWQIAQWLLPRVPSATERRRRNPISMLSRWKIFDNLRRSLVPPALTIFLLMGWIILPPILAWALCGLGIILIPAILASILEALRKPDDMHLRQHLISAARSAVRRLEKAAFSLACLPHDSMINLDAIGRTMFRLLVSRKRLLEWHPSHSFDRDGDSIAGQFRRMWVGPAVAVTAIACMGMTRAGQIAEAAPILALWFFSPLWAWWVSQPILTRASELTAHQVDFLHRLARRTWGFFETFVGPEDHWLPPDNIQANPDPVVSHRTSPTNMGLALLANLSAYDFGYISAGRLLERTANAFQTMATMERNRGHFYNWYETRTLAPLVPLYISTVDSGNLVGNLLVLSNGLLGLLDLPIFGPHCLDGLHNTLEVLSEIAGTAVMPQFAALQAEVAAARRSPPATLQAAAACLEKLEALATEALQNLKMPPESETCFWATSVAAQCRDALDDMKLLAPSGEPGVTGIPTLRQLETAAAFERAHVIRQLAAQASQFADLEYDFLYDKTSRLFAIGYNVSDRRRDSSFYDLLASEARLASFVAIAQGKVSQDNWFSLGRLLTSAGGDSVLVSWSGSMFEYLMPLLIMPTFENTLLDRTYNAAVQRQIDYGKERNVPWGISECGYNTVDVSQAYQYRAFGVPGLGLKRGLNEDLVIAPYATALALMVEPEQACLNLERLAESGMAGKYGLHEAIDYTPSRVPRGQSSVVIRSFMAHHQGMSFLSLAHVLLDRPMQKRFESDPIFQSAMLLLQERIPKTDQQHPHIAEFSSAHSETDNRESPVRVFNNPNTPIPKIQLLSNGRYHVMVTAAGGGYSRWKDNAVTRWSEDSTRDNWGMFCYVRDVTSGKAWSVAHQPTLQQCETYEAVFSESRVQFRRRDNGIDTHTEIAVSPEDDIELRRITITNFSKTRRVIDLTSYAEVVLAPTASDALHPAFSNLFVQTEILRDSRAILCTRRPRSANEAVPWMFHLMVPAHGAAVGDLSYETDRLRFIGRGRTVFNPQSHSTGLSGTDGSVLDPIVSIRCRVTLDPEKSVSINLVTGVGETRSSCMDLVTKYQDPRFADRTFDLAWTHSQVMLRQINATESDAQLYGQLAGSVIYANGSLRAAPSVLVKNHRNQSGLWGYAISGDLPIVLLRIADTAHIELVRQLVQAHVYWRLKGLAVDLVIWNEDQAGYRQPLQDQIMGLIAAGIEATVIDRPGGILIRLAEHVSPEDRILFQTVARAIVFDSEGTLAEQISRRNIPESIIPRFSPTKTRRSEPLKVVPLPQRDLIFSNGIGGFTQDGHEYVIATSRMQTTPAPWSNVLANEFFGTVITESGVANSWSENAHEFRLTPWCNDPVSETGGEAFYIRDEESGAFWSPTLLPCGSESPYVTRHGFGYSVFEHTEDGIRSELWIYVAVDAPVKIAVIKLRNNSGRARKLSITGYVEWVLADLRTKSMMHVNTEVDGITGTLFARNPYSSEFADRVAFFDTNAESQTFTGDRTEFIGRNGSIASPAAMRRMRLSGLVGAGLDPCAAIQAPFELGPGQEREVIFTLGAGSSMEDARTLAQRFRGSSAARGALEAVWRYWNRTLGAVQVETPDPSINVLANGWLLYQTLACRFWARSAFYQPGGAYGFRDQLQDSMALIYAQPELVRQHLLRSAARQFHEGDVQHWWHPPAGRGVRTRCSDDYLWLPLVACRYVMITGDTGVLDEPVHFLEGRPIRQDEDSYYDLPGRSDATASLYEHCTRAIIWGLRFGEHGLPLMGTGDWNDGMNLVGEHGKGESVWMAFFLYEVLAGFTDIAIARGDVTFAERCRNEAAQLQQNIEKNGWDGQWYRRAYFDDGSPLGSAVNPECQIDSIAQSWSVLSGAGEPERAHQAMDELDRRLVRRDKGLVQLLDPPFDKSALNPGYIKGYVPGVRENGGQYTHAAIWAAMAFAALADNRRAWELIAMINPVHHGASATAIATYKVEPYVIAADVYATSPHTGQGGWTWYTGSAGWMYRLMIESLLGLRLEVNKLYFTPCLPEKWDSFKVTYRYRETTYRITVSGATDKRTESTVTLDGVIQSGSFVPLIDDRKDHTVEYKYTRNAPDSKTNKLTAIV